MSGIFAVVKCERQMKELYKGEILVKDTGTINRKLNFVYCNNYDNKNKKCTYYGGCKCIFDGENNE